MAGPPVTEPPSALIDARIAELGDWRGVTLARARQLIHTAVPDVVEEWKWRGVPTWEHDGIVCTGETYRDKVKLTFAKGASLPDPAGLFNASLDGNVRRAIDLHEGEKLDARAFTALVRAAAAHNASTRKPAKKTPATKTPATKTPAKQVRPASGGPTLLAGGNPQIAKGHGEAPVQAYLEALPGWKRDVGARIDALISANLPEVRKAVKWNSPFYGIEGRGWIVSVHAFAKYLKVTFFTGTGLDPVPPGGTSDDARWIDVHEDDLDERALTKWVQQAGRLPGWQTSDIM